MQRHHRWSIPLMVVAALALAACDKNGEQEPAPGAEPGALEPGATTPGRAQDQTPTARAEQGSPPMQGGTAQTQPGQTQPGQMQPGQMQPGQACPLMTEGVTVDVSDTTDGVALTFTTATGDVEDLRNRVQHMANMYEMHAGHGSMMWQHHGHMRGKADRPTTQPGMGSPMPAATARAESVDNGARLLLTPVDASKLDELRAQVRDHQRRMSAGECWMAAEEPGGA